MLDIIYYDTSKQIWNIRIYYGSGLDQRKVHTESHSDVLAEPALAWTL
jgi:hypothetical protein